MTEAEAQWLRELRQRPMVQGGRGKASAVSCIMALWSRTNEYGTDEITPAGLAALAEHDAAILRGDKARGK